MSPLAGGASGLAPQSTRRRSPVPSQGLPDLWRSTGALRLETALPWFQSRGRSCPSRLVRASRYQRALRQQSRSQGKHLPQRLQSRAAAPPCDDST
ncbi:hypothetical protein G6F22_022064 [Rhizopus arrhizus]|nr:hypothetical protein G6F22_022064 [Rhizopus arrhizus]